MLFCAHTGPSMNPTLCQRDLLEVRPHVPLMPRVGDVILCLPPGADRAVVHRIVSLTIGDIRTRGDNNSSADPWVLQPSDIVGQVVAAHRASADALSTVGAWAARGRSAFAGPLASSARWAQFCTSCLAPSVFPHGLLTCFLPPGNRGCWLWVPRTGPFTGSWPAPGLRASLILPRAAGPSAGPSASGSIRPPYRIFTPIPNSNPRLLQAIPN